MKAVFALDHRFIPHAGDVLSEAQLPAKQWDRYLRVFRHIEVVSRCGSLPEHKHPGELNISSRPGISFTFVPDLSSPVAAVTRRAEAKAIIREAVGNADAVIARLPSETGLIAAGVARDLGKPWAAEALGCPWDGLWNYGNWQGKVYAPVMAWRMRKAMRHAPFAIYVTQRFLQGRYPCRNGSAVACSDVEIPTPSKDVLERRMERRSESNRPLVFGLVGSLNGKVKGIQTALAAFSRIREQLPSFEFRILGAGDAAPWRALAQQHGVADVTRFYGTLPSGGPVLEWLDAVDVYLQPSFKEGLPRALVEAMSRACPAIASSVAGIPELLEAEVLHRPGDIDRLCALLLQAASDPAWRMRQAARNWREAGSYARPMLESRRNRFWDDFAVQVQAAQPIWSLAR